MSSKELCCICQKPIDSWGNNPWPVKKEGVCCDQCNWEHVIPARLSIIYDKKFGKEKK